MSCPQQPLMHLTCLSIWATVRHLDVSVYMSYWAATGRVCLQEHVPHLYRSLYKSYCAAPGLVIGTIKFHSQMDGVRNLMLWHLYKVGCEICHGTSCGREMVATYPLPTPLSTSHSPSQLFPVQICKPRTVKVQCHAIFDRVFLQS